MFVGRARSRGGPAGRSFVRWPQASVVQRICTFVRVATGLLRERICTLVRVATGLRRERTRAFVGVATGVEINNEHCPSRRIVARGLKNT